MALLFMAGATDKERKTKFLKNLEEGNETVIIHREHIAYNKQMMTF